MQCQSTSPHTITATTGMILPTTVDPFTDLNIMVTAVSIYHERNERRVRWETLEQVMEAMCDTSAIVVMYEDWQGERTSRGLWPASITLTKEQEIVCGAYCTHCRRWKTFRLDRIITCHPLITPDDAEEAV